jgi:hypothetical protein
MKTVAFRNFKAPLVSRMLFLQLNLLGILLGLQLWEENGENCGQVLCLQTDLQIKWTWKNSMWGLCRLWGKFLRPWKQHLQIIQSLSFNTTDRDWYRSWGNRNHYRCKIIAEDSEKQDVMIEQEKISWNTAELSIQALVEFTEQTPTFMQSKLCRLLTPEVLIRKRKTCSTQDDIQTLLNRKSQITTSKGSPKKILQTHLSLHLIRLTYQQKKLMTAPGTSKRQ